MYLRCEKTYFFHIVPVTLIDGRMRPIFAEPSRSDSAREEGASPVQDRDADLGEELRDGADERNLRDEGGGVAVRVGAATARRERVGGGGGCGGGGGGGHRSSRRGRRHAQQLRRHRRQLLRRPPTLRRLKVEPSGHLLKPSLARRPTF